MKRLILLFTLFLLVCMGAVSQPRIDASGSVEWDTMRINTTVTLDLASAGIRLPAGRSQGESLLRDGYINLVRPIFMQLQVDSSSTIADLVNRGELSLAEVESLILTSSSIPPALSPDMRNMLANHSMFLSNASAALMRHARPSPIARTLNPVSAPQYSGIIIIAAENLPAHGMAGTQRPVPCLFPKIWDSEMNLIYERNMLEPGNNAMVRYSTMQNIMQNNPSGLSPELREIAGDRPLRIFARGVFGINPTDLIIDRNDALLIISSEENRRLLSQGRVVIILDESVLRHNFSAE
jgi:hypothetical protein